MKMATPMTLTVLCPNARRAVIKASKNTSILQVLRDACTKQNLDPAEFEIFHHNKRVDPSLSLHFANIPNNGELELRKGAIVRDANALVTLCIQLENGERLMADFLCSQSLWEVLTHWEKQGHVLNLSTGSGSEEPVCLYMRREIVGRNELENTTLESLGLSGGRAIIRYVVRERKALSQQANEGLGMINIPFKKDEPEAISTQQNTHVRQRSKSPPQHKNMCPVPSVKDESTSAPARSKSPPTREQSIGQEERVASSAATNKVAHKDVTSHQPANHVSSNAAPLYGVNETMEQTEAITVHEDDIKYMGPRQAVLFNLDQMPPLKIVDPGDSFFELTVSDAKYLAADYKRQVRSMENRPLETAELRRRREEQRQRAYSHSVVRVYFPNRLVLQGRFEVTEKVSDIGAFVYEALQNPPKSFYLYTSPPKKVLQHEWTLVEANLVPASVVYVGAGSSDSNCDAPTMDHWTLRDEIMANISTPGAASFAAAKLRPQRIRDHEANEVENTDLATPSIDHMRVSMATDRDALDAVRAAASARLNVAGTSTQAKVPKWFHTGKKT